MRVERGLARPTLKEQYSTRIDRVGAEGVLEAARLGSGRTHDFAPLSQERVAVSGIDPERTSDDEHAASLGVGTTEPVLRAL